MLLPGFEVVGFNLIDTGQTLQNVEASGLLGYYSMSLGERFLALQRNLLLDQKMGAAQTFEVLGIARPVTQQCIPQDQSSQEHCSENLQCHSSECC